VTALESCSAVISAPFRELFRGAGGGSLADAGVGAAASLASEEDGGGADDEVLEGEAVDACLVFSKTGGTKGYDRPVSFETTPMLLAPVSSKSRGEEKSSSAR
jgi:hypothetical protein